MNSLFGYSSLLAPLGIYAALASTIGGGTTSLSPASNTTTSGGDAFQAEISAYGQLLSSLSSFQYALQPLIAPNQNNTLSASSSNGAVASASASSGAQTASYTLTVGALAQAETVESRAQPDPTSSIIGSGTLTIQTGTYPSGSNSFSADGSPAVQITINNGSLNSIARAINVSGAGVVASVQDNSDGYHLAISRNQTGATSDFAITVNDSDGNNTDLNGLSQLAFDPTAVSGSGQNLTLTQQGENASYSVNGVGASSRSNSGISLASNVSADLLATGSSSISVNVNYDQLSASAQNLLSAFNALQSSVNSQTVQGAALHNDAIAGTLSGQLNQQAQQNLYNGTSTLATLSQIGLRFQQAENIGQIGTLTLDGNALQAAYSLDPGGASDLLALSAQGFNTLASGYIAPGYGTLPQTLNELRNTDFSQELQSAIQPQSSNTIPGNLSSLLQQQSHGQGSSPSLTIQQISALAQYATVLSLGEPFALEAMLVGNLGQIAAPNSAAATLSVFA